MNSYLLVSPRNPVAWHSSKNTNASYFSARAHISLAKTKTEPETKLSNTYLVHPWFSVIFGINS